MKDNKSRLLALLLVLAMVLPMVMPALLVSAEQTIVEEYPTETLPSDSSAESGTESVFYQTNFSDESSLTNFDLYQSGGSKFTVSNGELSPDGTDGEQKAILKQTLRC